MSSQPFVKCTIALSGSIPGYTHQKLRNDLTAAGARTSKSVCDSTTHLLTTQEAFDNNLARVQKAKSKKEILILDYRWALRGLEKSKLVPVDKFHLFQRDKPVAQPTRLSTKPHIWNPSRKIRSSDKNFMTTPEYEHDILVHMQWLELRAFPTPREKLCKSRQSAIEWIVGIRMELGITEEAWFLAVGIMDRFIIKAKRSLEEGQNMKLLALTSLVIAMKYDGPHSRRISAFSRASGKTFSTQNIISAERSVLEEIEYDLSYPTPFSFLGHVFDAENCHIETAKYIMEVCLLDYRFVYVRPSQIATSSMCLSLKIHGADTNPQLEVQWIVRLMIDSLLNLYSTDMFNRNKESM